MRAEIMKLNQETDNVGEKNNYHDGHGAGENFVDPRGGFDAAQIQERECDRIEYR